jgi:nucleoside-diphosphate-sugar epimerase
MRKPVTLITGANGEIGHGLISRLGANGAHELIALDLKPLAADLSDYCVAGIVGDILDQNLLKRLVSEYEIHAVFHLAALLSTRSEYTPDAAHNVNVNGTLNLLQLAHEQSRWHGATVKFLFPSSIAAYGLPDREAKARAGRLKEGDWNFPTTMYGCNKLYCEQLGRYFTKHFRQLAAERAPSGVDFRALRFPGIISAVTTPSGGTSDYAPEMIHAAAAGQPYACFVPPDARIPFMAMPDAVKALMLLEAAGAEKLSQRVLAAFPAAQITFEPDPPRAAIVDTWPADVDDSPAWHDWGWQPDYDFERAFNEYLVPTISQRYRKK